jgi:hypothetical protein
MVAKNTTGATKTYAGSIRQPADLLNLHPGAGGEQSTVRWTAPSSGTYQLKGRFEGIDTGGTTTNVRILHKDVQVWSGNVNSFGAQATYDFALSVVAGDTIDFVVGYGSNNTYNSDSTGMAAAITPISTSPTPTQATATVNEGTPRTLPAQSITTFLLASASTSNSSPTPPLTGNNAVRLIGFDSTIQGNSLGSYGALGYSIIDDKSNLPGWAQFSVTEEEFHSWTYSSTATRKLFKTSNKNGI